MRTLLKWTAIIPLVIAYAVTSGALTILPAGRSLRRVFLIRNTSFFSRIFLALFGIRVHIKHGERLQPLKSGRLIVSNHLSYLDVLVIASLAPSVFITSVELGNTVLLGMLARLGGSHFVERRKAMGLKKELAGIAQSLGSGLSVMLFPEGTTSNGDRVHPFKNALFEAARASGSDILPLCLRYKKMNEQPVSAENRNSVYYYGGASFLTHLSRLLALESVDVEVVALKIIPAHGHPARKELAAEAHKSISNAYHA